MNDTDTDKLLEQTLQFGASGESLWNIIVVPSDQSLVPLKVQGEYHVDERDAPHVNNDVGVEVKTSHDSLGLNVLTREAGPVVAPPVLSVTREVTAPPSKEQDNEGDFSLIPLDFQTEAVTLIVNSNHNWLLGDEMGLGKTIQALLVINSLQTKQTNPLKVLVVCPNSLRLNWLNECNKWLSPKREIEMTTTSLYIPNDFIIASYEGVKRWSLALKQTRWDWLIVDEAHYVKTPNAQRSKALYTIQAERKLFMTGTPIVNYPYELFPLLRSLMPEVYREASGFVGRYCGGPNNKYTYNAKELHDRLRFGKAIDKQGRVLYEHDPVLIRRLKKDVLTQLPKKRRQIIEVPCDSRPELKKLVEYETKLWASMDGKVAHEEILAVLNIAKEAGTTDEELADIIDLLKPSRQFFFEEMSRIRHQIAVAKLPLLIEHIQDVFDSFENGEKLVVFTHHNDVSDALDNHFKHKYGTVKVTGLATPVHERQACVEQFQINPNTKLFIGSMRVAGLGITLTAAHHIVFGELDWTPALITQCEDRCHRIGQEHPLLVQHFVVERSMDAFIAKKIVSKQRVIKAVLDNTSDRKGGI